MSHVSVRLALTIAFVLSLFYSTSSYANSIERLESLASRAKNLDDFLANKDLQQDYYRALKEYFHRSKFRCESYDRILQKLKKLSAQVPGFRERLWSKQRTETFGVEAFPDPEDKLAPQDILVEYRFKTLPRRFHAIFNDPSPKSCLSDNCTENDASSPDRWANVLNDSKLYVVERNGIFTDQSILVTPITKNGKTYPLVTFTGGGGLSREMEVSQRKTKKKAKTTLFAEWLGHEEPRKAKGMGPFVTMERVSADQVNIRPTTASALQKAAIIGKSHEFRPTDPLAKKMGAAAPRGCVARSPASGESSGLDLLVGTAKGNGSNATNSVMLLSEALANGAAGNTGTTGPLLATENGNSAEDGDTETPTVSSLMNIFQNDPSPDRRLAAEKALRSMGIDPRAGQSRIARRRDSDETSPAKPAAERAVERLAQQVAKPEPMPAEKFPMSGTNAPGMTSPQLPPFSSPSATGAVPALGPVAGVVGEENSKKNNSGGAGEKPGSGDGGDSEFQKAFRSVFRPGLSLTDRKTAWDKLPDGQKSSTLSKGLNDANNRAEAIKLGEEIEKCDQAKKSASWYPARLEGLVKLLSLLETNASAHETEEVSVTHANPIQRGGGEPGKIHSCDPWDSDAKPGKAYCMDKNGLMEPLRVIPVWVSLGEGSGKFYSNDDSLLSTWYPASSNEGGQCMYMATNAHGELLEGVLTSPEEDYNTVVSGEMLGLPDKDSVYIYAAGWPGDPIRKTPPGWIRYGCTKRNEVNLELSLQLSEYPDDRRTVILERNKKRLSVIVPERIPDQCTTKQECETLKEKAKTAHAAQVAAKAQDEASPGECKEPKITPPPTVPGTNKEKIPCQLVLVREGKASYSSATCAYCGERIHCPSCFESMLSTTLVADNAEGKTQCLAEQDRLKKLFSDHHNAPKHKK